jgi:hypothetical protein
MKNNIFSKIKSLVCRPLQRWVKRFFCDTDKKIITGDNIDQVIARATHLIGDDKDWKVAKPIYVSWLRYKIILRRKTPEEKAQDMARWNEFEKLKRLAF